jgi:hypothetical protein
MQIEYEISEDDFVFAARLAVAKRNRKSRYALYVVPVFGTVLILCGAFMTISQGSLSGMWPVFVWGTFLLLIPAINRYQYRRQYRKMPMFHGKRLLEIDDTSLHFVAPDSDSRTTWQVYTKYAENDHVFVLFQQGERMFIPLPKRDLSPLQVDELRTMFQTYIRTK